MKKNKMFYCFTKGIVAFIILLLLFKLNSPTLQRIQSESVMKLSSTSSILQNGYRLYLTVSNTSSSVIEDWTLKLKKSEFTITSIWGAKSTISGNDIIITPLSWNNAIGARGKVSFGFTGKGTLVNAFYYELSSSGTIVTPPPTDTPQETIEIPSFSSLQSNAKLPDPFLFKTGTRKGTRVESKSQWFARRAEISALAQAFEFGVKPPKPQTVTGSFSNNAITISCSENGKSISFQCKIQYPSTGSAPYPAMIGVNMNTLNTSEILKLGVALITFPADEIGQQVNGNSRGKGKFFDLYGSNYDAGALITWAWGVDRLIDALETTPAAKIDPKRLGVTGGSRNGKGALAIGAFDERIALTVPQESGNGGASGWRTADAQKSSGQNVQTLSQIIRENCWFAKSLNQFSGQTNKLPYDHHEIEALCAPRGLLVIENPDFEWLGNFSCYNTSTAGHMIYEALGVPENMGYSSVGGHGHCQFPSSQQPELIAYIQKFLLGKTANTNVFRSDKTYNFDKSKWVNWTIPTLQ